VSQLSRSSVSKLLSLRGGFKILSSSPRPPKLD